MPGDLIAPDMEDPSSPTYFGKHGIPTLDDKPRRIEPGVSQMRSLMWNPATQQSHMAILDDGDDGIGQNEDLVKAIEKWTHLKTALGFNFDKFEDDHNCDFIDPSRYALAPFVDNTTVRASSHQGPREVSLPEAAAAGDPVALETIQKKSELMNQFKDHMFMEHGLKDVFKEPKKSGADKEPVKGNKPVKYKF